MITSYNFTCDYINAYMIPQSHLHKTRFKVQPLPTILPITHILPMEGQYFHDLLLLKAGLTIYTWADTPQFPLGNSCGIYTLLYHTAFHFAEYYKGSSLRMST